MIPLRCPSREWALFSKACSEFWLVFYAWGLVCQGNVGWFGEQTSGCAKCFILSLLGLCPSVNSRIFEPQVHLNACKGQT